MGLSQSDRDKIVKALQGRGATAPCPRCGEKKFTVADGYFTNSIQDSLTKTVLGGRGVPSAVVICDNCGFMSQHALGALGLLPKT